MIRNMLSSKFRAWCKNAKLSGASVCRTKKHSAPKLGSCCQTSMDDCIVRLRGGLCVCGDCYVGEVVGV